MTVEKSLYLARNPDILVSQEKKEYEAAFAVLTISGKGSSGNSALADNLGSLYKIPSERIYHMGEIVREYARAKGIIGRIKRSDEVDREIDMRVQELILNGSTERPIIIEAKLGGVLNRHIEYEAKNLGIVLPEPRISILKWADANKRAEIAQIKSGGPLPLLEIKRLSKQRDNADLIQWRRVHEWMSNYINILDKDARDDRGRPIYDYIIDSSKNSLEDDILTANIRLIDAGYVTERTKRTLGSKFED